jgi:TRAP-type C4-dicarboxylate transport system permease small subunit
MYCSTCGAEIPDIVQGNKCPKCGRSLGSTKAVLRIIALVEDTVISIMLCSMVLLVLVQIALRNIYASGITGGAEVVRHLVLWVAFLGAGIAAREGKHIRIDVIYRILPLNLKRFTEILTSLFTMLVCGILLYASIQFIRTDFSLGTSIALAFINLPVWIFEVVIPLGYGIVMLRYGAQSIDSFLKLLREE